MDDVWELRRNTPSSVATVSAASFDGSSLAIESIVAAFGGNLATETQAAATTPLPTSIAGTSLKIKDKAGAEHSAPLFYVSPAQVNFLIPAGTGAGTASLTLTSGDGSTAMGTFQVTNVAPSLFSANANGQGVAAAVALRLKNGVQTTESVARWDASQNRFVPIPLDLGAEDEQVFLVLFGTGVRYHSGLSTISARIGGTATQVTYAGPQNDFVGLDQINVGVPRSLIGRGEVEITFVADGRPANIVMVSIK